MKGIIVAGGKGTRLRPLTYTGAKQLVPVANKPVLFYAVEDLVEAGISEIGIVVPADHQMARDQIMAAVGNGERWGARITYIPQDAPRGIAHAVAICRDFVGDQKFVAFLGDNFIREGIKPQVDAFREGFAANTGGEAPKTFAPKLDRLATALPEEIKEGQVLQIAYAPGTGSIVSATGGKEVIVEGKDFSDALFMNWFGPKPPNDDLKRKMLKR